MKEDSPVVRDPDILGGTPVFAGTRVPAHAFVDYVMANRPLNDFLDDYPSVQREQVLALIKRLKQFIESMPDP